jgi:hypothetical protein
MMIISDARLYGLPIEILAADREQLDALGALCVEGRAEARRALARASGRRALLYGAVGGGSVFLLLASLLAIRALWPTVPIFVFWVFGLVSFWLLYWLFNTHDRLNQYAERVSEEYNVAKRRHETIANCVTHVAARKRKKDSERHARGAT